MLATDQGKRPKVSTDPANIVIQVKRNENFPQFPPDPYSKTIRRDAGINTGIVTVSARDDDDTVTFSTNYVLHVKL